MKAITDEYAKKLFEAICRKYDATFKIGNSNNNKFIYAGFDNGYAFRSYSKYDIHWVEIPRSEGNHDCYKKLLNRMFKCLEYGPVYAYAGDGFSTYRNKVVIANSKEEFMINADLLIDD